MEDNNDGSEVPSARTEPECEPGLSQNSGLSALAPRVLFRDDGNGMEVDGSGAEGRSNEGNDVNEGEDDNVKMGGAKADDSTGSSSEDDSSSGDESGSSSSSSDSDDEGGGGAGDSGSISNESIEDDGLSDYERLRLRNIRRNQARLARLGLLGNDGSSASTGLLAPSGASEQSKPSNKRKKKPHSAAPVPRRSLPRRRCAKLQRRSFGEEDDDGHESDESSMASPVKIRHILRPQPHQEARLAEEGHLKQYLRTRRIRRGRPKREEYEYRCEETCGECGGEWRFDNNPGEDKENDDGGSDDEDVEEATRLVRCKGCRKAFHVGCMLIHGKGEGADEAEGEDDRKPAAIDESLERPDGRDPKRCHRCEAQYRRQKSSGSSNLVLSLLEAVIGDRRTLHVRVTTEPALEAIRDGVACRVTLSLGGERSNGVVCESDANPQRKSVSWSNPLEEEDEELPKCAATDKIRKLVARALSDGGNARLQDHSCEALRRHLDDEASTAAAVKLGGIRMLVHAMRNHPERPVLQAEAMCTLGEIAWRRPDLGIETVAAGGLELVVGSMERHGVHSKVQQFACGYFRALSYDRECCDRLEALGAVKAVIDGIARNPRKVNVLMEGSMFLQNLMVVSPAKTARSILGQRRRVGHIDILPTLLSAIQSNPANADLAFAVFGLLANVAANNRARDKLQSLGASEVALAAICSHPQCPGLLSTAFAFLSMVSVEANDDEDSITDLVESILQSMERHAEDEAMQVNACQLLEALSQMAQRKSVQNAAQSANGTRILRRARENFPDGCQEIADGLLGN